MFKLRKFLMWVLVLFLEATDWSDGIQSNELETAMITATIQPRHLLLWSGDSSKLYCSFSQRGMNASDSDFSFYSSNPEINRKLRTEKINASTIRTTISVDRNMSSENISCRFRNDSLDEVTLLVANKIRCRVKNWESMICSWELFHLNYDSNFSLIYQRSSCAKNRLDCPHLSFDKTHGHCEWRKPRDGEQNNEFFLTTHCFRIKIESAFGKLFKLMGEVNVRNFVKPNPVSDCRTWINNSSGNHSVFIKWTAPNNEQNINYRVTWMSKWSAAMVKNSSEPQIELHNLIPNTNYSVTIDCIPLIYGKGTGFWSDPKILKLLTDPDVPGASPKVTHGGYKEKILNASHRSVELFYQPPEERLTHGDVKCYRVNYSSVGSPNGLDFGKKETETEMSVSVDLRIDIGYNFTVEAKTVSGYNTTLAPEMIFISSVLEKPPFPKQFVVVTDGKGLYFFSWTPVSEASAYTVYWCNSNSRKSSCLDVLQWKTVSSDRTSAEMAVTSLPERTLRFFISAERNHTGHVISSGMLMSNCTYLQNGEPRPPHDFRVLQGHSTSLIAEWSQSDETSCQRRAYPAAYVLFVCSIHNCEQTNMTIRVNSSLESFEIIGLEPSTAYRIMIKSISEDGRESNYEQRNETTVDALEQLQDKRFIVIIVVVGFFCLSFAIVAAVIKCFRWYKEKFDVQVVIPKKYYATNTGFSPEHSCYSNFDSPSGKMDTIVMADNNYDVARTPDSRTGETQTLLLKRTALSTTSSGYTNETSLQSLSLAETSEPDEIFLNPDDVSGYNLVVERACQLASVARADSGNGLSTIDSTSDNMDNLVMVGFPDA